MNRGPLLFLAAFFTMATSWLGFVLVPQLQIGRQQQVELSDNGQLYPSMRPGTARQGEQIYRANGCFYCHTRQVRPKGFGTDVERGWGARPGEVQSVNEDYLYDRPVMLGTQRVGPDLANIGLRQPDAMSLLKHLYNPRLITPNSVMPPYRFLFEKRKLKLGEQASAEALPLGDKVPAGYEILPTDDALTLVAYLLSQHQDAILFETPPPPTNKVAAASSTNAPATAPPTNAPAASATPSTNGPTTNSLPK
jgi:cytochrome c oxidase cbb3-type subunit 2